MRLAVDNPPILYPRSPFLAFWTSPFMHIGSICSIHIATDGTFGLVCILPMIGPRNSAMTAALLAVRIKVTNFYGLFATFPPLNWHIDIVHIYLPSQRSGSVAAKSGVTKERSFLPSTGALGNAQFHVIHFLFMFLKLM